jgi:hypothetical protein
MGVFKITDLGAKNQQKNVVVAELLHEHVQLKEELEGPQKWAKRDANLCGFPREFKKTLPS